MRKLLIGASTVIGCALVFAGSMDFNRVSGPRGVTEAIELTISKAYAGRRHARRTTRRVARRTTRRVIRRHSLAHGCVWRAPYHYCGGVYYQPIVESGATVYIVVYP
jgi:hypothetical protein